MRAFRRRPDDVRYSVEWRDHRGRRHLWVGYRERQNSVAMGQRLERLAACIANRMPIDGPTRDWLHDLRPAWRRRLAQLGLATVATPLAQHLTDYEQSLRDRGRAPRHVQSSIQGTRSLLADCGIDTLEGMDATAIERHLAERRAHGMAPKTSNNRITNLVAFVNWLVSTGRIPSNPVRHLVKVANPTASDPRRAFTEAELGAVFSYVRTADSMYELTGEQRYWLYRVAVETGLRKAEIASLTVASFDWRARRVSVAAADTKSGKHARLPLLPELAKGLRGYFKGQPQNGRAFRVPPRTATMLQRDLTGAGIKPDGLVFHSFRHTFATRLVRSGANIKAVQALMRHADVTTTLQLYAHADEADLRAALVGLPKY